MNENLIYSTANDQFRTRSVVIVAICQINQSKLMKASMNQRKCNMSKYMCHHKLL